MKVIITDHGGKRARERIGINHRAVRRMANKVFVNGYSPQEFGGPFRRYLDGVYGRNGSHIVIRFYGEHIWIFGYENALITVLVVPHKYRSKVRSKKRRTNELVH